MSYLLLRSCYFIRWRFGVPLWDKFSARDPRRNNNQREFRHFESARDELTTSQAKNDLDQQAWRRGCYRTSLAPRGRLRCFMVLCISC